MEAPPDGGEGTRAGMGRTVTNERGVERACANKRRDAWKHGPETSDLSLPSVFPPFSLPKQKIKFAVNMS